MSKTEVAKTTETALSVTDEELQALIDQQDSEFDDSLIQTPILKIGQGQSREVVDEQAEPGEFIDTLTGEGIGNAIGFIVSYYQRGRFAADDDGRAYTAFGDTIPPHWEDLVGPNYVGTPFDEYPDAEEKFKAAVNAKEREWGSGPVVSTTHNFTGYAVIPALEEDEEDELRPVRLSLKRTDVPAARKWLTIKRSTLRGVPFWDKVFDLTTEKNKYSKGAAFNLVVKVGRDTTPAERQLGVELAQAVAAGRAVDNQAGDSAKDKAAEPDAQGGLGV